MGLDISSMQHTAEPWLAMNSMGASAPETSTQEIPVKDMNLSALYQLGDDPYTQAQQIIDSNPKAFTLPESPKLPTDMEMKAREIIRMGKMSSDGYQAKLREFAAQMKQAEAKGLSAKKNDQGTPAHIKALENMIGNIHDNYQKTYAKINQKAAEYMKDVNTALGKISDFIKAGGDGKINFRPKDFLESLDKVFKQYTSYEIGNDYKAAYENWSPDNSATLAIYTFEGDHSTKDFWQNKLGDGFIVKQSDDGKNILVLPNLDPIRSIYSSIAHSEADWEGGDTSSQAFQSLQASIDSQKNTVNSSVSQLLERFRQDNSTFETFIQLLVQMTKDLHQYNLGYIQ
ncbi:IpaD/SipD/SspD family type III secretion system needle tip protein [Yersinia aldovae]|uniref:IpaD/SipD/SspD family type III secretion system needle tip protein n=1 Tax=Yersinia aldovae TaxID=29483 RepID=UPI0005ABE1F6|nr:IpaD/SipD/SspD family type III secretion system needle tip protein [Yersinia aldovae]AJJ62834.1 invasion plasmid antigen IpaD family protein [Yersinia aldovae 670-83]